MTCNCPCHEGAMIGCNCDGQMTEPPGEPCDRWGEQWKPSPIAPPYADLTLLEAAKTHSDEFNVAFNAGRLTEAKHHKRMAEWLFELYHLRTAKENVRVALADAERAYESMARANL